jgi:SAM-dependent methyltransferase
VAALTASAAVAEPSVPTATVLNMASEYPPPENGSPLSDHAARARATWDEDAPNWVEGGRRKWDSPDPLWGAWDLPEEELRVLPDVRGRDVIDLGCGTGYWSAWFARLGARPVGLDLSEAQLETARMFQREHGIEFPLVHGSAEGAPLPTASFDLAFSEYGAATWCDPYAWIPEAHRLLRPGGWLIFLRDSALASLCYPPGEEPVSESLMRPQLGLNRIDWSDGETDFHLPHGPMVALLRETGFELEALHELYAPEGPDDEVRFYMRRGWARRWAAEDLWVARRPPA